MSHNTEETTETGDENHVHTTTTSDISRRGVLAKTTAAGTALIGGIGITGSVAADQETGRFNDSPGRGGQAVIPEDDFEKNKKFAITERTGDSATEIDGAVFQCNTGNGESIFLVGWNFTYEGEDEERILYTRSNNIDTSVTYDWQNNGSKICESGLVTTDGEQLPEDAAQSSYRAVGNQ